MGSDRAALDVAQRVAAVDWAAAHADLDERGHAVTPVILPTAVCASLIDSYGDDAAFRTTVDLGRYRFGVGEYRYFDRPLPPVVAALRTALYPPLAAIANAWAERLGEAPDYPARLEDYLARCHAAGQTRPTPLLLRYTENGYNCLHQDRYGDLMFPLQVAFMLTEGGRGYTGGEFLLVEQRPRMQSRGEAIALGRGQAIVFPSQLRPVAGARGHYRVQVRHGVSRIRSGLRMTLGLIFHDAR